MKDRRDDICKGPNFRNFLEVHFELTLEKDGGGLNLRGLVSNSNDCAKPVKP